MSDPERRFAGIMSDEYDLMLLAHPHYFELQSNIKQLVSLYRPLRTTNTIDVLEIGCGDGYTTKIILSARQDLNLSGIDNEITLLTRARSNISNLYPDYSVDFIEADALDFLQSRNTQEYDIIVSAMTFHNWHNDYRCDVLKEVYRLLRPGGLFINADKYVENSMMQHKELLNRLRKYFEVFLPIEDYKLLEEWTIHEVGDTAPDRIMYASVATKLMEQIGFKDIEFNNRCSMEVILTARW